MTKGAGEIDDLGLDLGSGDVVTGKFPVEFDDLLGEDDESEGDGGSLTEQAIGDNPSLADEVEVVVGAHFMELGQIRSILRSLEVAGRTNYKIFSYLSALTLPYILDLIKRIGGKNFGDLMLEVFYGENKEDVAVIGAEAGFSEISTNRAFYVDTEVSREIEKLVPELMDDFKRFINKYSNGAVVNYFNPDESLFRRYLMERMIFFPQVLDLVDEVYKKLQTWDPDFTQGKYRLRGSMVFEDWLDTQVAGVSPSGVYDGSQPKDIVDKVFLRNCDHLLAASRVANGDPDLWKFRLSFLLPYVEFFFHKKMSDLAKQRDELIGDDKIIAGYARYDLEGEEQLGIQVVPQIEVEKHIVAVIDKDNTVRMDLNLKALGDKDLLMRVMVDESNNVTINYGFTPAEHGHPEFRRDEEDDGLEKLAYLSKKQILGIVKIMRLKKSFYGFDVDGEFCLTKDGHLFDVQTRVAPDVVEMESDQELNLRGYTQVAESCFGLGQKFMVKGKLVFAKNPISGLFVSELNGLMKQFGDLGKYILLLNEPLAASLFGLQRLAFEKGSIFAGVIDMSRGVALTHSPVQSGASHFLRNNIAVMGTGDNTDALFNLVNDGENAKFVMSEVAVIMKCEDGKTVQVYAPNEVAVHLFQKRL